MNTPSIPFGGRDIVYKGATTRQELKAVLSQLRAAWPECVVQDAVGGWEIAEDGVPEIPAELLVYKNEGSRYLWNKYGAVERTEGTMIQVIFRPDSATLVIDTSGKLAQLAQNIWAQACWSSEAVPLSFFSCDGKRPGVGLSDFVDE